MTKNEWDDYAEMWDSVASGYAENAFAELIKIINLKDLHIFDFGCGTGLLTERMAPLCKDVVALDNSRKMTKKLKNKNIANAIIISESLTPELTFAEPIFQTKFDLIVASSVCGFLPNYEETLELLYSLLNPGGTFVQWDWLKTDEKSETGFTKDEVLKTLNEKGFKNVSLSIPFKMSNPDGEMPVLMAIAKK